MSLIDKLMAIDSGEFAKEKTKCIRADHLSEVMGEDVMITIRALPGDLYNGITARMIDKKGNADFGKAYDINALICAEGVVEPDLRNEGLQKHFRCATPKSLAKVLFPGGEIARISDAVTELSGFAKEDEKEAEEDELKN